MAVWVAVASGASVGSTITSSDGAGLGDGGTNAVTPELGNGQRFTSAPRAPSPSATRSPSAAASRSVAASSIEPSDAVPSDAVPSDAVPSASAASPLVTLPPRSPIAGLFHVGQPAPKLVLPLLGGGTVDL